ncbi:histidine kinase [Actinomadura sp. 6N118]|uniref:GAF domain-containing sensor histidine kinase n=1 Tax=Actinomadura sp. 6N118 TaxID=3375151 RepID=UPI0037950BD1
MDATWRAARTAPTRPLAVGLFVLAAAGVIAAIAVSAGSGRGYTHALDTFVVSNSAIGLSFALCGLLIAWHRPRNPLGWLLLADGIGHAVTAGLAPVAEHGVEAGWPEWLVRTLLTVAMYAWPWSIGLCLPLILQLFPDGRPAGPVFRRLMWATVATAPLFVVSMGSDPEGLVPGHPGYLTLAAHDDLVPLWTVAELTELAAMLTGLVSLAVRYRRGDETLRRQLLWLTQAVLLVVIVLVPWGVFQAAPIYVLLAIPLVPAAMTVAIIRHRLLDIRLVVSRTVLYVLLTAGVLAAYVGLVAMFDTVMRREVGLGSSALATVAIAVGFNPVRVRLQRAVDRVLYGDRADPVRAVSRVGARLDTGLPGVLEAVREALRMPFAALRAHDTEMAASGTAPELLHTIPLTYAGERVGELVVGLRQGERRLGAPDRAVLELLAAPLSVAVHAVRLSDELQRSREALVVAREEERRRLRRDLHDGLGPVLTGVVYKADAAGNLLAADPGAARGLVAELRAETTHAIEDIRRLVYDLRPPALDDLGLAGAVRQRAAQLDRAGLAVRVEIPPLPELPAAVEAAAYRITAEAMTNAVRHSGAGRVEVRIHADGRLHVEVADDGGDGAGEWRPGVGLSSMRERAAELGGTCTAGPGPGGGRVTAVLPLGTS